MTDFSSLYANLRAEFRRSLPDHDALIAAAWAAARTDPDGGLTKLRKVAHSLAGMGGTFGCLEISECAGILERELRLQAGRVTDMPRLSECVAALQRAITEIPSSMTR